MARQDGMKGMGGGRIMGIMLHQQMMLGQLMALGASALSGSSFLRPLP